MQGRVFDTCLVFEPPKSIKKYLYLCDKKFHIEQLLKLYEEDTHLFGIVHITGAKTVYYKATIDELKYQDKITVNLPKKHKKGGQSQNRFQHLREHAIEHYITRINEGINRIYVKDGLPIIEGLIFIGNGEKKDMVHDVIDRRLKEIFLANITICETDNILERSKQYMIRYLHGESVNEIKEFESLMGTGSVVYGTEIKESLDNGLIKKLLCEESIKDTDYYEDIVNKCKTMRCELIILPNNLHQYGEIIGILWYPKEI